MLARMPFFLLVMACVCGLERNPGKTISVDVLELNTMHDAQAQPTYQQVIAWQRMPEDGRLHNVGWRIVGSVGDLPEQHGAGWSVTVYESHRVLRVVAPQIRRSWTQCDPERVDTSDWWRGNAPNVFQQVRE